MWRPRVKDKNNVSALLSVCIIPGIITELLTIYDDQAEIVIKEFFKSNLFDKLQNPATGLWHLSSKTLTEIYLLEKEEQILDFPEEQS